MKKKIGLIDVSSLIYRSYFALPYMSTSTGEAVNAVYGFVNMYWAVDRQLSLDAAIACFDSKEKTFREDILPDYKAQRQAMPDDFYPQIDLVEEFLGCVGAVCLKVAGYEADDLIASAIKEIDGESVFYIVSSDKDLSQLVSDNVFLCRSRRSSSDMQILDREGVKKTFGVYPEQMVDFLSLVGDTSDNIKGVSGVGQKTAASLLDRYKTLEGIFENIDDIKKDRLRQALLDQKEMLLRNKRLIKVRDDINLDLDRISLDREIDADCLYGFYRRLEFESLIKKQFPDKMTKELENSIGSKIPLKDTKCVDFIFVVPDKDGAAVVWPDGRVDNVLNGELKDLLSSNQRKLIADRLTHQFDRVKNSLPVAMIELATNRRLPKDVPLKSKWEALISVYCSLDDSIKSALWDIDAKVYGVLLKMESAGLRLDKESLLRLSDEVMDEIESLENSIADIVGERINLNSPKQLAFLLYEKLGLPVLKKGKNHPSTNEAVLKKLLPMHNVVKYILDYRELNKIYTGYIIPLLSGIKEDGKIYAEFSLVNTRTGRITAVKPNLQTVPIRSKWGKRIREAFISRYSGYIVSADYSQIELRVLAHLSQDKNLLESFWRGSDIHILTASRLFGKPVSEISARERDIAKRVNFGIIYGITPRGLAGDLGIDFDSATKFIRQYFEIYPAVREFIDATISRAKIDGYVKTYFGHIRHIPEINSRVKHIREFGLRAAVNTVIQGTAADIIKLAMIRIDKAMTGLEAKMVLQIHDELLFDCPEDELETLKVIVRREMESVGDFSVPLVVDVSWGRNWLEAK